MKSLNPNESLFINPKEVSRSLQGIPAGSNPNDRNRPVTRVAQRPHPVPGTAHKPLPGYSTVPRSMARPAAYLEELSPRVEDQKILGTSPSGRMGQVKTEIEPDDMTDEEIDIEYGKLIEELLGLG